MTLPRSCNIIFTSNTKISWPPLGLTLNWIWDLGFHDGCCALDRGCLPFMTSDPTRFYIGVYAIPSRFDKNWHSWFWQQLTLLILTTILTLRTARRALHARRGIFTFHEHLIPLPFCKEYVDSKLLFLLFTFYLLVCF